MKQLAWHVIGGVAALAIVGAGTAYGIGIANDIRDAAPAPASSVVATSTPTPSATPTPTPTPTVAPVVEVAPPAPPVEEAPAEPDYGTPIPWIPDPNNAEGGYYDTTQCPSGAGYQAPDGNQYCS